uniref:Uncharacterized protein n=1 Tax=Arundo donax TaxID=35708 RepID=A0A0A9HLJ1_ARUDO
MVHIGWNSSNNNMQQSNRSCVFLDSKCSSIYATNSSEVSASLI